MTPASRPPPDLDAQLRAFVAEETGLSGLVIDAVILAETLFWQARYPDLLARAVEDCLQEQARQAADDDG